MLVAGIFLQLAHKLAAFVIAAIVMGMGPSPSVKPQVRASVSTASSAVSKQASECTCSSTCVLPQMRLPFASKQEDTCS